MWDSANFINHISYIITLALPQGHHHQVNILSQYHHILVGCYGNTIPSHARCKNGALSTHMITVI